MAVPSSPSIVNFVGTGAQLSFDVPYQFFLSSDLLVTVAGVTKVLGTDYSVSGSAVVFVIAPANAAAVVIRRATPFSQSTALENQGIFFPKSIETSLDKLTLQLQELRDGTLTAAGVVQNGDVSAGIVYVPGTSTGRTSAARAAEFVNVKDYGAVGDGTTDDTAAINAALAVLTGRSTIELIDWNQGAGGTLFFPRGVYKITSQIAWTADNITLRGENKIATAIKVAITSSPTTTDAIKIGNASGGGGGRRGRLQDISIYTDTNYGTNKCRDFVYIDGATWWSIDNVNMRNPGRYGVRVGGTLHGTCNNLHVSYAGASGVRIERDSAGTAHTSSDWYHLYSHDNWLCGMHIEQGNVIGLYSPIFEYNGKSGTASTGNGLRLGDAVDQDVDVSIFNGYWEANLGWDIITGIGTTSATHNVHAIGGMAVAKGGAQNKTAGSVYGFYYGQRAAGSFMGIRLADYTVGFGYLTYSLDDTCKVSILGQQGDRSSIGNSNRPVNRTGASGINDYRGGIIQWSDQNGSPALFGSYIPRAGYSGTGAPSIPMAARSAAPNSGTWELGDLCFNTDGSANTGRQPFAWRCIAAGSPGTWEPVYSSLEPDNGYVNIGAVVTSTPWDGNYRVYGAQLNTNLTTAIQLPTDNTGHLRAGRILVLAVGNNSGGALTGLTFAAGFKWAGAAAPAAPNNQTRNILTFYCDGSPGNVFEIARSLNVPF